MVLSTSHINPFRPQLFRNRTNVGGIETFENEISPKKCSQLGAGNNGEREIDRSRVLFIVRSKFRKATKNRFLGYAWLVLDPFVISMIYLFVFSVVKANPDASSILVGVTMYRVFQGSLMNGLNCIGDLNGGFKSERIVTKVIVSAEFLHRVIDVFLQTSLNRSDYGCGI